MKVIIITLVSFACTFALGASKSNLMTNEAIGRQPATRFPSNASEYWVQRTQAINFSRKREWDKAIPLLKKLTQEYSDDGDTWFLLGHGYLQTNQCEQAIPALKQTLGLGTIMTGIKSASSPSNDIMIKIAQCYADMGNESKAIYWIERALKFRWDDRKSLISSSKFKTLAGNKSYQQLSGEHLEAGLSRNDAWLADLQFFLNEIKRLHVDPYHSVSEEALELKAKALAQSIPNLSDQQVVYQFMELLASVGNGHNFIVPTHSKKGAFTRLPVQFYRFSDGVYIVSANSDHQRLIGRKVLSIDGMSVERAMEKIVRVNARDNEMQQYWLGPYYLALPEVLKGLGIVKDAAEIHIALADKEGTTERVKMSGEPFNFKGFPTLPKLEAKKNPAYLKNKDENYWYFTQKKDNYLFVQLNAVAQNKTKSLAKFSGEIRQAIEKNKIENLVLDLRHNSGGNGSIIPPLTRTLIHFVEQSETNRLFVIVGRNTFSAAHLLLADLNRLTDAIIVGEPSGSRPNHLGEAGWFKLPYSGVWGIISSQYHQASKAEDHRIWIAPHMPVALSSDTYFKGEDPAMKQILATIER
jgi:tetratricopeptide (TPR) repeat protein